MFPARTFILLGIGLFKVTNRFEMDAEILDRLDEVERTLMYLIQRTDNHPTQDVIDYFQDLETRHGEPPLVECIVDSPLPQAGPPRINTRDIEHVTFLAGALRQAVTEWWRHNKDAAAPDWVKRCVEACNRVRWHFDYVRGGWRFDEIHETDTEVRSSEESHK